VIHPDVRRLFTEAQVAEVEAAVARAEKRTSAEIVPWVVAASDGYAEADWRGAMLGVLGALAVCAVAWWWPDWVVIEPRVALGAPLAGAAAGYLIARWVPAARRWLAGSQALDRRVRAEAIEAFVDAEVFATERRTGLLIFVSLLERRCLVLPDRGAAEALDQAVWSEMARRVSEGVRGGAPAAALSDVIDHFGDLLATAGLAGEREGANELPDRLRFEEP